MRLLVDNIHTVIEDCPPRILLALDRRLSYPVKGAWFSHSFKAGRWDGKVHLIRVTKDKGYTFPTGLLPDVMRALDNLRVRYEVCSGLHGSCDVTRLESPPAHPMALHPWTATREPRSYQKQAVDAWFDGGGKGLPGIGILSMPIRSGKTFTAALIIERLGARTLFVVPSLLLLEQTAKVCRECFGDLVIGEMGGGRDTEGDITVATYQSLMVAYRDRRKDCMRFLDTIDLLIVDELHHAEAEEWRKPLFACNARYRLGLSATVYVSRTNPNEVGAIWLKALCGPIVFQVDMAYLVRKGWLVKTTIAFHTIENPKTDEKWSQRLYSKCITNNTERNARIVSEAVLAKSEGKRCLVDIGRVAHGRILLGLLRKAGLKTELLIGSADDETRGSALLALKERRIDVLVSTLLGEGVDIPELEVVVNAEGGAGRKGTIQRLRNMTIREGKDSALIVDFVDLTSHYLAEHSKQRIASYRKEGCFDVIVRS